MINFEKNHTYVYILKHLQSVKDKKEKTPSFPVSFLKGN